MTVSRRAVALSASALALLRVGSAVAATPRVDQSAPDLELVTFDGARVSAQDLRGRVVVLNFWATWCAPCVKEMPTLDALQVKMAPQGVQVMAISQDKDAEKVAKPFFEKNGWKNVGLFTEAAGKFYPQAKLRGLPTTLIIDKQGREVARVEGETDWGSAEIEAAIKKAAAL